MRLSFRTCSWILALGTLAAIPWHAAGAQGDAPHAAGTTASAADRDALTNVLAGVRDRPGPAPLTTEGDPIAPPQPPGAALDDPATRDAYLASVQEYYRYRTSGFQHRRTLFEWQYWSSRAIFVVVLALVGIGMYFAAVQFHLGLRSVRGTQPGEGADSTELVANLQGLRVRSPVLGVIILVISMAFFYLYLAFVYPIRDVL